MSQPWPKRNEVTAWTMPGRCGQLSVRMNLRGIAISSALDHVDSETTARGLLVLVLHVRTGVAHGLDRLVERDELFAVTTHSHPGGGDRLDRSHGISLDTGDLHEAADGVAGEPEIVLDTDLRRVLHLVRRTAQDLGEAGRRHRARRPDLSLAAHLCPGDRGVLLEQDPDRRGGEQEPDDTVL